MKAARAYGVPALGAEAPDSRRSNAKNAVATAPSALDQQHLNSEPQITPITQMPGDAFQQMGNRRFDEAICEIGEICGCRSMQFSEALVDTLGVSDATKNVLDQDGLAWYHFIHREPARSGLGARKHQGCIVTVRSRGWRPYND